MSIAVGQTAPDFTLQNQDKKEVKLSDFAGKRNVVLLWYPLDWSPVCTSEHACFVNDMKKFETLNAEVLGVSVDSVWSHKAFADKMGIKYSLLADFHPRSARFERSRRRPVPGKSRHRLRMPFIPSATGIPSCSEKRREIPRRSVQPTGAGRPRSAPRNHGTSQVFSHLQRIVWISASMETCVAEKPLIENFLPLPSVKRKKRLMWYPPRKPKKDARFRRARERRR